MLIEPAMMLYDKQVETVTAEKKILMPKKLN